jgi:hypothetical protein
MFPIVADDGDCDGTLTADDCNDTDATSTILADDADCDGTLTADDCNDTDASSIAFIGENIEDYAGRSVSPAGDVDGDGLDDLFVGATYNDDGAFNAGKAYLLLGSTLAASTSSTIDLSNADFAFIGERSRL